MSHHLKVLTDADVVTREKRGVWAYCTLAPDPVGEVGAHSALHLGDDR